jgi:uncharacterized protein (TIGR00304 family)
VVDVVAVGFLMILAGVVVIIFGVLRSAGREGGQTKSGAVVLVGPIPIAFGSDAKWTSVAIALAVVLMVLTLILYLGWP